VGDTTIGHRFLRVQYVSLQIAPVLQSEGEVALRRDRIYQYRFSPPPLTTGIRSISIPQWGQPSHADDPDHLRLQDLQEFEITDFQSSLMHSRFGEVETSHGKRMQGDGSSVNEPAKRPRLDTSRILDWMPQVCACRPSPVNVTHHF
jgi:hypothetical protein